MKFSQINRVLASEDGFMQINPIYTQEAKAIKKALDQERIIILHNFLTTTFANNLSIKQKSENWKKEYVPDKYRRERAQQFRSNEITRFIRQITGIRKKIVSFAFRFGSGDYTLLNDAQPPISIFVDLDLTKQWNSKWGGYTVLERNNEEPAIIPSKFNSLIIARDVREFVKYVNHDAGRSKRILIRTGS